MTNELVALFSPVALSLILFGSAARGEDVPGSDVDVLVVTSGAGECETIEESAAADEGILLFGTDLAALRPDDG